MATAATTLLPLAAIFLATGCRAELKTVASVEARTTYTDNVQLAPDGQARSLWIAELVPGLAVSDHRRRLQIDAGYQAHLYGYSRNDEAANRSRESEFHGALHAEAIDDFLFFDASGAYRQQQVSAFGPPLADNNYLSANRAQVKSYRLSPYLRHSFGPQLRGELHYTYDAVSSDQPGFARSTGNSVQATLAGGGGRLGWTLYGNRQRLDSGVSPASTATSYRLDAQLAVLAQLRLTASAGHERYTYAQQAGDLPTGKSWSVGMIWTPTSRTSITASVGRRYFGNSNAFEALHRTRRSVWSLSYSTDVTTARDQFLLPASVSTAALLDGLFAASVSDPVLRQQAVAAFIRANGLPASLSDNINYFSNRYVLQKQLQLSSIYTLPRSALMLSLFDNRRQALSAVGSDSVLLGPVSAFYNDNIRQQGGGATLNMRLRPHTTLNLSATTIRVRGLGEGGAAGLAAGSSRSRQLRAGLTQQLGRQLNAAIELRRQQGRVQGADGAANPYRENAVVLQVSQIF